MSGTKQRNLNLFVVMFARLRCLLSMNFRSFHCLGGPAFGKRSLTPLSEMRKSISYTYEYL